MIVKRAVALELAQTVRTRYKPVSRNLSILANYPLTATDDLPVRTNVEMRLLEGAKAQPHFDLANQSILANLTTDLYGPHQCKKFDKKKRP